MSANDGRLLAMLRAGDVVAQELKYYTSYLAPLYNNEKAHLSRTDVYPLAFSELITYMTEGKLNSEGPKMFRLAEMASLYKQRLQQLGV